MHTHTTQKASDDEGRSLQAKEHRGWPASPRELGERPGRDTLPPLSASEAARLLMLGPRPLTPRPGRQRISVVSTLLPLQA